MKLASGPTFVPDGNREIHISSTVFRNCISELVNWAVHGGAKIIVYRRNKPIYEITPIKHCNHPNGFSKLVKNRMVGDYHKTRGACPFCGHMSYYIAISVNTMECINCHKTVDVIEGKYRYCAACKEKKKLKQKR